MQMGSRQQVDPGNDHCVLRVYLHWHEHRAQVLQVGPGQPPLVHVHRQESGIWLLQFSLDRGPRRQRHFIEVDPDGVRSSRWAIVKLAPGVWDIPVSIHVPGQFHGFVTLIGVPEPAPWALTG